MKIKTTTTVTEIEATAEELRQGNTLSDAFCTMLRNALMPSCYDDCEYEGEEQDDNHH